MKAIVFDDINVKVLDGKYKDYFFLFPNSARRDIVLNFAPYEYTPYQREPFRGKQIIAEANIELK